MKTSRTLTNDVKFFNCELKKKKKGQELDWFEMRVKRACDKTNTSNT